MTDLEKELGHLFLRADAILDWNEDLWAKALALGELRRNAIIISSFAVSGEFEGSAVFVSPDFDPAIDLEDLGGMAEQSVEAEQQHEGVEAVEPDDEPARQVYFSIILRPAKKGRPPPSSKVTWGELSHLVLQWSAGALVGSGFFHGHLKVGKWRAPLPGALPDKVLKLGKVVSIERVSYKVDQGIDGIAEVSISMSPDSSEFFVETVQPYTSIDLGSDRDPLPRVRQVALAAVARIVEEIVQ
ncbi:MAG: hypothetical protein IPG45_30140 [Deltaproteobacteria bacterium]|nr:hypothetical protein [Deltaproteobacteria bacterium]